MHERGGKVITQCVTRPYVKHMSVVREGSGVCVGNAWVFTCTWGFTQGFTATWGLPVNRYLGVYRYSNGVRPTPHRTPPSLPANLHTPAACLPPPQHKLLHLL